MFEFTANESTLDITIQTPSFESSNVDVFKEAFEEHRPDILEAVTVDLAAVEMIDSSAIGALLSVYKQLDAEEGSVRLEGVRPAVISVIELLRLHRVFDLGVAATQESAQTVEQ